MNEESALLAAIILQPDEDVPRLAYADWLQERDQEPRAEFIRVQVELARLQPLTNHGTSLIDLCVCDDCLRRDELRARERHLKALDGGRHLFHPYFRTAKVSPDALLTPRRGFVEEVTCSAADWLAHADAIHWHAKQKRECPVTAQPARKVVLTTRWDNLDGLARAVREGIRNYVLAGRNVTVPKKAKLTAEAVFAARWPGVEFDVSVSEPAYVP